MRFPLKSEKTWLTNWELGVSGCGEDKFIPDKSTSVAEDVGFRLEKTASETDDLQPSCGVVISPRFYTGNEWRNVSGKREREDAIMLCNVLNTKIYPIVKPSETRLAACHTNQQISEWPLQWKLSNVSPAHKNDDETSKKNYHPISVL